MFVECLPCSRLCVLGWVLHIHWEVDISVSPSDITFGSQDRVGFLNLSTADTLGQTILCCGRLSRAAGLFRSTLGL